MSEQPVTTARTRAEALEIAKQFDYRSDCEMSIADRQWLTRTIIQALDAERQAAMEEASALVPSNWCDPLLTGPESVLHKSGSYNGYHIEALLNGIKVRIQQAQASRELKDDAVS